MEHCKNFLVMSKMQRPMIMTSLLLVVAQADSLVPRYDMNKLCMKLCQKISFHINHGRIKQYI